MAMKITVLPVTLRELFDGYANRDENGVVGYHGRLDIRPPYQRRFIYDEKQKIEVARTVMKGLPLNTMYWVVARDGKGDKILDAHGNETYELLDGQQRTMSICEYLNNAFVVEYKYFFNIQKTAPELAEQMLDYQLQIYVCDGTTAEKLEWFRIINTAGEALSEQELLNAQYTGPWLTDAKFFFSATNCQAGQMVVTRGATADKYLGGSRERQGWLESAIEWITDYQGLPERTEQGDAYMSNHQGDQSASELKEYYSKVMHWVGSKFKVYRKEMKGLGWGYYYNMYQRGELSNNIICKSPDEIESEIQRLIADEDVNDGMQKKNLKAIYQYILTGQEKWLSLRAFPPSIAHAVYEKQQHRCPYCDRQVDGHAYPMGVTEYKFEEMEADHIIPWHDGGKTIEDNCQMLCKYHNRAKSGK